MYFELKGRNYAIYNLHLLKNQLRRVATMKNNSSTWSMEIRNKC